MKKNADDFKVIWAETTYRFADFEDLQKFVAYLSEGGKKDEELFIVRGDRIVSTLWV